MRANSLRFYFVDGLRRFPVKETRDEERKGGKEREIKDAAFAVGTFHPGSEGSCIFVKPASAL